MNCPCASGAERLMVATSNADGVWACAAIERLNRTNRRKDTGCSYYDFREQLQTSRPESSHFEAPESASRTSASFQIRACEPERTVRRRAWHRSSPACSREFSSRRGQSLHVAPTRATSESAARPVIGPTLPLLRSHRTVPTLRPIHASHLGPLKRAFSSSFACFLYCSRSGRDGAVWRPYESPFTARLEPALIRLKEGSYLRRNLAGWARPHSRTGSAPARFAPL